MSNSGNPFTHIFDAGQLGIGVSVGLAIALVLWQLNLHRSVGLFCIALLTVALVSFVGISEVLAASLVVWLYGYFHNPYEEELLSTMGLIQLLLAGALRFLLRGKLGRVIFLTLTLVILGGLHVFLKVSVLWLAILVIQVGVSWWLGSRISDDSYGRDEGFFSLHGLGDSAIGVAGVVDSRLARAWQAHRGAMLTVMVFVTYALHRIFGASLGCVLFWQIAISASWGAGRHAN